MLLDVAIVEVKRLISFFEKYRETGFSSAMHVAKEIASELEVEPVFPQKRVIRRKKQFDESVGESSVSSTSTPEELFRVEYFVYIVDQSIGSLTRRFGVILHSFTNSTAEGWAMQRC
ncbi:unnamed protein product [Cuscuta europaea]|uniref:Uncharacterized protein n=1 Tax=Cuscuta europaea TaxID=41803 RepID=A0A9P0ZMY4_CUSEU|nr:unnamed protein product [Cuscuta europaea]